MDGWMGAGFEMEKLSGKGGGSGERGMLMEWRCDCRGNSKIKVSARFLQAWATLAWLGAIAGVECRITHLCMYVSMYVCISLLVLSLSFAPLSLCPSISVFCTCVCMCVCVYIKKKKKKDEHPGHRDMSERGIPFTHSQLQFSTLCPHPYI